MGIIEVLAQDELWGLVHHHRPIQAVPHHIGVERVAVREVDARPQGEGQVEMVRGFRPALREDRQELLVTRAVVHDEGLVHLLGDGPARRREGHLRVEGIRLLRLIKNQWIRRRESAVRRPRRDVHDRGHRYDNNEGDDDHNQADGPGISAAEGRSRADGRPWRGLRGTSQRCLLRREGTRDEI